MAYTNYNCVLPNLCIGAKPPQGNEIACQGFSTLVLCAMEYQPDPEKFPGVRVLQCPFMDDDDPEIFPEAMLLTCAKIAAYQVHAGNKVLVTCQMGWNRSGIVTALTLYRLYKITGQEALEAVRNARPHALSNEFFADYLRKLPLR